MDWFMIAFALLSAVLLFRCRVNPARLLVGCAVLE